KAITLVMPVTCTRRPTPTDHMSSNDTADDATFTRFVYRPHWFVLSQTDGQPLEALTMPTWNATLALEALGITEEPFTETDGNCQGYGHDRAIAVSPVAVLPHKTRFHELAHVVLGHTAEAAQQDGERTPKTIREVEAEAVALLCLEALGLPGADHCRGYIQ